MKKSILGGMFLVMIVTIGFVFAGPIQNINNLSEELKTEIQETIIEKDYSSFVELHQGIEPKGKAFGLINEENFALFSEMKQAILEEDFEKAREIREELGISLEHQKLQRNKQINQLQRNENKGIGKNKGNGQAMQMRQQKQLMACQN